MCDMRLPVQYWLPSAGLIFRFSLASHCQTASWFPSVLFVFERFVVPFENDDG